MQKVLNSKEVKKILNGLKEHYGIKELKINKVFLKNPKDKIYLTNKKISEIKAESLRINLIGLYFAKQATEGVRLSIEGSQLIGKKATKNIAELDEEQIKEWLNGLDITFEDKDLRGFVMIKHKKDFYGVGRYKDGKILNYVPKDRRIHKQNVGL